MKVANKTTRNMFEAVNPRKHSQKPAAVRDMIVSCSGDLPRLELFARQQPLGWDVWGDEVDNSIDFGLPPKLISERHWTL